MLGYMLVVSYVFNQVFFLVCFAIMLCVNGSRYKKTTMEWEETCWQLGSELGGNLGMLIMQNVGVFLVLNQSHPGHPYLRGQWSLFDMFLQMASKFPPVRFDSWAVWQFWFACINWMIMMSIIVIWQDSRSWMKKFEIILIRISTCTSFTCFFFL